MAAPASPGSFALAAAVTSLSAANDRSAAEVNNDQLRATIQRQADTIESLHAAASKYKSRLTAIEQQLTVRQAEVDSLKVLSTENATLREERLRQGRAALSGGAEAAPRSRWWRLDS